MFTLSTEETCLMSEKFGINNSVGADDIPAKVYKFGYPTLFRVLAYLFNKILSKQFLHSEFMKVLLVPMITTKTLIYSDCRTIGGTPPNEKINDERKREVISRCGVWDIVFAFTPKKFVLNSTLKCLRQRTGKV